MIKPPISYALADDLDRALDEATNEAQALFAPSENVHYGRAKAELEAAERATTLDAVRAHCALAELHLIAMDDEKS